MKNQTKILQRELDKVQNQIDILQRAVHVEPDYGLGEGDPAITRREVDRALLKRLSERAETLKRAISGIGRGTYGICRQCGDLIHPDRLAVLPDTRLCVHCAKTGSTRADCVSPPDEVYRERLYREQKEIVRHDTSAEA